LKCRFGPQRPQTTCFFSGSCLFALHARASGCEIGARRREQRRRGCGKDVWRR
jgi:hypothetical protein